MPMNQKDNFYRLVDQESPCGQCGKRFPTFEGFRSDREKVTVCSLECVEAWCAGKPTHRLRRSFF